MVGLCESGDEPSISIKWEFLVERKKKTDLCHEMSFVVAAIYGLCTATSTILFFFCQMQPDYYV